MSQNNPRTDAPASVSRRDFLRRAGKEAAQTGVRIVPGAALAQKALGLDSGDNGPRKSLMQRLADWRGRQTRKESE